MLGRNRKGVAEYIVDGDRVILGFSRVYPLKKFGTASFIIEMAGLLVAVLFGSGFFVSNEQVIILGIFAGAAIYMFGYKRRRIYTAIRDWRAEKNWGEMSQGGDERTMEGKAEFQNSSEKARWSLTKDNKVSFGGKRAYPIFALLAVSVFFKFFCVVIIILAIFMTVVTESYVSLVTVVMGAVLFMAFYQLGKVAKEANGAYLEKIERELWMKN